MQRLLGVALLGSVLGCSSAVAEMIEDHLPEYRELNPWEEQEVAIPPFPAAADLIRLDTEFAGYRYFVDPRSLSVGEQDQVVRYTVVVESPAGPRNVFHEGIRCDDGHFKTYAYAAGEEGPFTDMPDARWRPISSQAAFRYRRDLHEYYLCDGPAPRFQVDEIVKRIQYPPSVHDSTYHQ